MKAAICDNEKIFLNQMAEVIGAKECIDVYDTYLSIEELFQKLKDGEKYDIIFMDIDWKNDAENGINYAAKINQDNPDIQMIFVTAYNDIFSENIFFENLNLCGYLKKPINSEYLGILLEKAEKTIRNNENSILTIKNNGLIENIKVNAIIYLESQGHKVTITKTDGISYTYEKLDTIQERLGNNFLRIHKSYLVNMDYISRLEGKSVVVFNEKVLPVSKSFSKDSKTLYLKYLRGRIKEIN